MNKYKQAFKQMISEVTSFLSKEYRTVFEIWLFTQAMLGITLSNDQSRFIWIISNVIAFVVLIIATKLVKTVNELKRPMKRFTKKTANGDIFVEEDRLPQALIYLSILEDQLEEQ